MTALAYAACMFGAGVVGVSMAAVINALGVPVKMAFYCNEKGFLRSVPWVCAAGAAFFSYGFFSFGASLNLPNFVGAAILLMMGAMLGMNAVSLAEMLDVFTGPFNFIRISEFKWLIFFIAFGKAVFCALQLLLGYEI